MNFVHRWKLLFVLAMILGGNKAVLGQAQPNLEAGFKPYGSFHGTDVDTVAVMNGNVTLHIPFPASYPQRGKLKDGSVLILHSKGWNLVTVPNTNNMAWTPNRSLMGPADVLHPRHTRTFTRFTASGHTLENVGNNAVVTWDGATHPMMDVSNGQKSAFEAIDGSGWRVSLSNPNAYGVFESGVLFDREGTQYTIPQYGTLCPATVNTGWGAPGGHAPIETPSYPPNESLSNCNEASLVTAATDAHGNTISLPLNSAWTDTMGKNTWSTPPGVNLTGFASTVTQNSNPPGCSGVSSYYGSGVITYPDAYGTQNQILVCYANFTIQTNFGIAGDVEYPSGYGGETDPVPLISSIVLPDGGTWTLNYDAYGNVTYVGLPLGGSISYQYVTVPFPATQIGSPPVSRAVSQRTITDNNGHSYTWKYQWMTSQSNPNSPNGTFTNIVTDPLGNDTVHVFTNLQNVYNFYETTTQVYQGSAGSGTMLKQVVTNYQVTPVTGDTGFGLVTVLPTSIQTTVYPSGQTSLVQKIYDTALTDPAGGATSYGKVVTEKEYDWGQGSPGALLRETDTTYEWQVNSAYLAAHVLDLPATVVVKDGSGCALSETDYTYDESQYLTGANITTQHGPAPRSVRGNLTTVTRWLAVTSSCNPKGGTAVVSHTNWYDTGEVYQQIDPLGHTTTHSYDPAYAGAFATKTCNPLSQCVSATYDFTTGLMTSFTNANATQQASGNTPGDANHTINYAFDFMSRMTSATFPPDPGNGNAQAITKFNYPVPVTLPFTVTKTRSITPTLTDSATSTYDGLGRVYKTQHALPNGIAEVDTVYDGLDRVTSVSNPYFSTSDPTYGLTQTFYDALGRPTQVTKQDGSVSSVAYDLAQSSPGDCTQTTDEASKQRLTCSDGLGRLIRVWEDPNGLNYETDYQYDGLSNLLRVDQKGSAANDSTQWRTRTFTHDTLGRLLTANNPESGTIFYSYDNADNLVSKRSPAPNQTGTAIVTTAYNYDPLNRLTQKSHSDGVTPTVNFFYDTPVSWGSSSMTQSNLIGRLSGISTTRSNGDSNNTPPFGWLDWVANAANGSTTIPQGGNLALGGWAADNEDGSPVAFVQVDIDGDVIGQATIGGIRNDVAQAQGRPDFANSGYSFNGSIGLQAPGTHTVHVTAFDREGASTVLSGPLQITVTGSSPADTPPMGWLDWVANAADSTHVIPQGGNLALGGWAADSAASPGAPVSRVEIWLDSTLLATANLNGVRTDVAQATGRPDYVNSGYSFNGSIGNTAPGMHLVSIRAYDANDGSQTLPGAQVIHVTSPADAIYTSTEYSYDVLGREQNELATIGGVSKGMSYGYNLDGSLAQLNYPSGATVTYTPDSAGRVLQAVDNANSISYASQASYGPDGSLTGFVSGASGGFAGISNSFSFNKRLQPVNMSATSPSATIFSLAYDFHYGAGDNGNVWGITNNKDTSRNQAFTYDPLNRLISAQNAGTDCTQTLANGKTEYWGNTYGYDAWGNLLSKSVTKCSAESLSVTAAANNQLQGGYLYDQAGNMTHDATSGWNYTYDQENRITGANGFTYTYDGDGNRVEKSNGSTGTLYWYMSPGIVAESDLSGNLQSEYVFFDGERVARKDFPGGAVSYYFSDHLKTTDIVTDAQGNIKNESDFYPWGGELPFIANDSNHYKFTGKERDIETGLDYFGARYYSNGLGRFITPDWAAKATAVPYAEFADPQSLNLYTYVQNVPTTRFDRDGHDGCDPNKGWCQVVSFLACWCQPAKPLPLSPSDAEAMSQVADKVAPLVEKLAPAAVALGLMTKADQVKANQQQGKDFEQKVVNNTQKTDSNVSEQVTVKTESGVKTRIDVASTTQSGQARLQEAKSSATADLTTNQAKAFPEIQKTGATVVGQGKPGFPGGTKIPPTEVEIVRPVVILE